MGLRFSGPRIVQRALNRARHLRLIDRRKAGELTEIYTLQRILRDAKVDCVFDVGANEGQYAGRIRKLGYRGQLVCFEPLPEERMILERRARKDPLLRVESGALSHSDGEARFNVMHGSQFSSLSQSLPSSQDKFSGAAVTKTSITVSTETLATMLERIGREIAFERPFLKLDTQGHDHSIIMAGSTDIRRFVAIQTELAISPLYEQTVDYLTALEDYRELGFRVCALVPNNWGHFPHLYEIDCLMIRDDVADSIDSLRHLQ